MSRPSFLNQGSEWLMVSFSTGILLILFIPIPASLLDLLFITNVSWAMTILLLTFYTDKPLSFSTFPALLLISTLFRLALNISATRLILSNGDAGRVINAIGQYIIHDNYVMGLAVFIILIIVQYVVVTHGAQRVAEVAARFTLDSMPGKQMSIDADLNMGIISHQEAKHRRAQIEKEANFYGAMDGASKFVKGDAVAGILIMAVDLIGGFAIGMAQKGLGFRESIQTYSLLTVGDGLITQIPALTISLATGIIVTRAATDAHLGREVAKQIAAYPKSLLMVCLCLLGLLGLKGMPVLPVLTILSLFAITALFAMRAQQPAIAAALTECAEDDASLYEKIQIRPIELELNPILFNELKPLESDLLHQIKLIRQKIAYEMGFVIPEITLRAESRLPYPMYAICIQGQADAAKECLVHQDKTASLIQHVTNAIKHQLPLLLSRMQTEKLLDQPNVRLLRDELIPAILSLSHVQRVLQHLLEEHVSIRDLPAILETLLEHGKSTTDPHALTELVRARLATAICKTLMDHPIHLPVLTFAPHQEQALSTHIHENQLALEPRLTEQLLAALLEHTKAMINQQKKPVLLCRGLLRRPIRQLTQRIIPGLFVISMHEIPLTIQLESFQVIHPFKDLGEPSLC